MAKFFDGLVSNVKRHRRAWITGGSIAVVLIGGGVGFWNWHSQPSFCAICHPMDPYYESLVSSDYMAYQHGAADVGCLDCHEPTISQQIAEGWKFVTGDYENPLPEMEYPTEDCLDCHMENSTHNSWEEIIALTAHYEDEIGRNPHNSPHMAVGELECQECHKSHKESVYYCSSCHPYYDFGPEWVAAEPPEAGELPETWDPYSFCLICHQMVPYDDSLGDPALMAYAHAQADMTCYDCHDDMDELAEKHNNVLADPDNPMYQLPLPERQVPQEECLGCHMENSPHSSWEEIAALTSQYEEETGRNPHNPPEGPTHLSQPDCQVCHKSHKTSTLYCILCHEDLTLPSGWEAPAELPPGVSLEWDPEGNCLSCHQMVPYEESLEDQALLAYTHAQADMSCYDCHTNMEELTQKHNDVLADPTNPKYQLPLRERRATQEECFSCHMENSPHNSWEEIAALTQDYVIAGELHNPHDPHVTRTDDQVDCRSCHKMHKESPNVENPENYCFGCHHQQIFDPCSTCH